MDISTAWKTVKVVLGENRNLAPTAIKTVLDNGEVDVVTNPKKLANLFNNFFRRKIERLREKTNHPPSKSPHDRLKSWLNKRDEPPPQFKFQKIDKGMLRKILKKLKPKMVQGVDWIDSFSLKVASPLIEDSLLHLINLSIMDSSFVPRWKPQMETKFL